jgi:DNA-binding NarL/FixJ family response regulator
MDYIAYITKSNGTETTHKFSSKYDAVDAVHMVANNIIKSAYGENASIKNIVVDNSGQTKEQRVLSLRREGKSMAEITRETGVSYYQQRKILEWIRNA